MKEEILVIDYEPSVLELLGFILSKDYELVLKPNCYDALLWLENRKNPDLILLDIEMPCFDGMAFIKSLKVSGLYRDIPIVVLSKGRAEQSGSMTDKIQKYILKPFNPLQLKQTIGEILQFQNQRRNHEFERFYN